MDGSIRVWRLDTLQEERVLLIKWGENEEGYESEDADCVFALVVCEGQLISGYHSCKARMWDVNTGERRRERVGHTAKVGSLCVVGSRLAS